MKIPRRARATAAVCSLIVVATLAACGGSKPAPAASPTTTPTITAPQATTAAPTSPLTGLPGTSGSVIAFKIDNTAAALPHVGLASADVVYVEEVEGGLTRIAAIFASHKPAVIAPIRSARETDAELLPTYGHIPVAFSGSIAGVHAMLVRAGLVDVSEDKGELGYYRLGVRYAPYNLAGQAKVLVKRSGTSVAPHDVGFTFGDLPAGGRAAKSVVATFPSARIGFTYDKSTKRWVYRLDGRLDQVVGAHAQSASDVLIQYVRIGDAGRVDKVHNPVPFTSTIGSGKGVILRDGRAYKVTWSRASKSAPTVWLYKGQPFPLRAGQPWVVLADRNSPVRLG